jgi:hypothetical protein
LVAAPEIAGRLAVGWFSHSVVRLDAGGTGFDFHRPELASSCSDALAFDSVAFPSVVHRDSLFVLAVVTDSEDSKDEVTPCCLTSRRSQPPLALAVPLSRFTSRVGGGSAFYVRPPSAP